jgi:hypothetical protein
MAGSYFLLREMNDLSGDLSPHFRLSSAKGSNHNDKVCDIRVSDKGVH